LGDTTGIAVAEQIRKDADLRSVRSNAVPVLVFVSAHESYCKQLFRFDAAAFLSKPINEAEVKSLLLRVYRRLRNPRQMFMYYIKDEMFRIPLADILFFESKVHKIEMVTKADSIKPSVRAFYGKISEIEARLKHPGFIRTHHSMLVNLDNVERFEKNALFLPGGYRLPLARNKQKEVRRKIRDYFKGISRGGAL
jgi:DNA-binding LytR/AlgR family response regulator